MSSNAIASQPSNKFQEILGYFKGNGASITENVDTSKKTTKLSDEAKAALIERIQENLSGIDVSQDIKSQDNDNGLLSAKVVTLGDTSPEKLNKMNALFSDVLQLIQDSGGKVDKTFLSQKSDENPELRAKVIELATVVSMTKNEGGSAEATTAKSLSEAVVSKTSPNLFIDSKAGLTQAETNAVRMMLFSDKDSTAFAGALTLLQSVQNYKEVAPDTLIEKEVDGVKTLKGKAGSFYQKIDRALGNSESANFIKQVLFNIVNTALHGRLNEEQQAVLRDDPSLKAVYGRVHSDFANTVDDAMRKDVIRPLKEEIENTFSNNQKISQYFGNINGDKVKGLLRKLGDGILKMIRPEGKGFAENAFGKTSFHEANQEIMTLSQDSNSALVALTKLASSIGTVQNRLEDGGAARLDIPLSVIAKSGDKGKTLAAALFQGMAERLIPEMTEYQKDVSVQKGLLATVNTALNAGGPQSTDIGGAINSLETLYKGTDAVKNNINQTLTAIDNDKSKDIGRFTVTKTTITTGENSEAGFTVQLKDSNQTMTLNQENTKLLLAAMQTIDSTVDAKKVDPKIETASKILEAAQTDYNSKNPSSTVDIYSTDVTQRGTALTALKQHINDNPLPIIDLVPDKNLSIFFGLDKSKSKISEDKKTLADLAEVAPDIKADVFQVKSDLDILSKRIAELVKKQSGKFAHIALTSGAALKDGLLDENGTFQVANSLKQNLFATALSKVKDLALEKLTGMERMNAEQDTNLLKIASSVIQNKLFTDFVATGQENSSSPETQAKVLKAKLEEMKNNTNRQISSFAEEFLANSENKDLLKIEGNTAQDKAKYQAVLSKLVLELIYTKDEGLEGKEKANKVSTELSAFINASNVKNDNRDSSSDEVRELRADVNNTKNVLAANPDKKEMLALTSVINGRIRDFDSLNAAPSSIKEKILDAMVTGLMTMAKNSAVKLEPLAELIKAAEAPSESNELAFFNRLKTSLVAA
jgi:hypothetical protein